ncbi:CcoQ/FixQ family Cbb3-type cytochrome c oxidase assembly chaperone [Arcobacter sp. AHV-9/2010]|uniref:CcoQ/FixQ family Cbb3-type cytochrome c oxidase assembly chaperone n=1 Tax=Arcobacteraceae TaxID=2808963 RepID=UPI00100B5011|nr:MULTISPECIES: CcoQ/FixQ family Cbb3-type cytochrome c oxidase assembly chaperone [Arcobacteraceae]MDX4059382.1 CcoQ/FixQ family Cbb3-type cytochrome c oxidase assembly chaperone [Aliarcobacter skirrowii]RXJ96985.1 CcoQ/FixQ family Cbb3-type cytochrome c oxidase assembly chaperone [Arcobacter sp. CECT 9299]
MDYETLVNLQGYVKFFLILIVFVLFYSYAFSIYRRDRKGERDFEKYSKLVHDDSSVSEPLEKREEKEKVIGNKEK